MMIYAVERKSNLPSMLKRNSERSAAQRQHSGVKNILRRSAVQAKLIIGVPNDKYEQEADRVADQVMRMPQSAASEAVINRTSMGPPKIQRLCDECESELELQRKAAGGVDIAQPNNSIESDLQRRKGRGEMMAPAVQVRMEGAFGVGFSGVRIHRDNEAAQMSQQLSAHAFTHGSDIYFNQGKYSVNSAVGERLLAHELTHVIQQAGGMPAVQRNFATPAPEAPHPQQPDLTDAQIREAIRYNSRRYDEANTRLIQDIMGGPVTGRWEPENIRAIAENQEEFGLQSDGKVGPQTFQFIEREQVRIGSQIDPQNCLTMFRVIRYPVRRSATAGPDGVTVIRGHHVIEARFSARCDCSRFQYRQFVSGVALGWRGTGMQDLSGFFDYMPGGRLPGNPREDGNTECPSVNYGHREQLGQERTTSTCGENHYMIAVGDENQQAGCVYRGEDFPLIRVENLQTGDDIELLVRFRGEIQFDGVPIQIRHWIDIDDSVTTP